MSHNLRSDTDADSYSASYFDDLYNGNIDPWQYQTRWYEKRKRDMCLAVLPQAQYYNAIELGCGNGVFSELLASRSQNLVSIDGNEHAVHLAQERLQHLAHVKVIQATIPNSLATLDESILQRYPLSKESSSPENLSAAKTGFDLIVISEILYYLSAADIDTVIKWAQRNLAVGGTLLCCHWRYAIDGFIMTGETVHQRLYQAFNSTAHDIEHKAAFTHQSQIIDTDFLLDIWQNSSDSLAKQQGLVQKT